MAGKGGIPSCCSVGDVQAGPSWSKHLQALSWVRAPLLRKHQQVSPCKMWRLPVITPACRSREPPGAWVHKYPGTRSRETGSDRYLGVGSRAAESPSPDDKGGQEKWPSSNPSACIASTAPFEWTGPQGQAAMPTNKHVQQASNPPATVNHGQPLR